MIDVSPFVQTLEHKPIAVFGLARSGLSGIKALKSAGAEVYAWDDREEARVQAQALGAQIRKIEDVIDHCGELVLAPGVPLHFPKPHDVVVAARAAGVEILCDIEILYRSLKDRSEAYKFVGITGTNGKSTTTALLDHVLRDCGHSVVMGGNIGVPALDLPLPDEGGAFVLEISSYQLDLCSELALDIAVLLNITPDHLDRHGDMDGYITAKKRIFHGAQTNIIGVDDEICAGILAQMGGVAVSSNDEIGAVHNPNLRGEHNQQNMAAVLAVGKAFNCDQEAMTRAFNSFPGLPHRQFMVRQIGDISYINDSKATNAEAASKALGAFDDIYWIAGGQAKEGGLDGLESYLPRIRHVFLIGEAAQSFSKWLEERGVIATLCGKLDVAVQTAHNTAQGAGQGVVLLSPACASFDQFSSFEARGERFTQLVEDL